MKNVATIIFLILLSISSLMSQEVKIDDSKDKSSDIKTENGFSAHLIVVKNPREFIQEWVKQQTPKIKAVSDVKKDESIGVFVLFAGCSTNSDGVCNSEVDYTVYKPDGTVYAERLNQPLWKEKAPPAKNIQLGKAILTFRLGKNNYFGEYKVKAKVSDLNADISFQVETKFLLIK